MIDNTVDQLLSAANPQQMAAIGADLGYGNSGEWPPAGEHQAVILDIRTSAGTLRLGRLDTGLPCVNITFQYKEASPKNPDGTDRPGITWWGRDIEFVPGDVPSTQPENVQTAVRKNRERLKGHLSKILNVAPDSIVDIRAAITQVVNRIKASDKALVVRVYCDYYTPEGKTTTYKTDFIRANLSVAA